MGHFEFEREVLGHQNYYVLAFRVDVLLARVHIELIADPNQNIPTMILDFTDCKSLTMIYDESERDPKYLPLCLGLQNLPDTDGTRYIFTTDVVEVNFCTKNQPEVTWQQ
jgi:hypothetical protein